MCFIHNRKGEKMNILQTLVFFPVNTIQKSFKHLKAGILFIISAIFLTINLTYCTMYINHRFFKLSRYNGLSLFVNVYFYSFFLNIIFKISYPLFPLIVRNHYHYCMTNPDICTIIIKVPKLSNISYVKKLVRQYAFQKRKQIDRITLTASHLDVKIFSASNLMLGEPHNFLDIL